MSIEDIPGNNTIKINGSDNEIKII